MPCCKHPLAVWLKTAGYADFAKTVEKIAADDENLAFRAKQDQVRSLILDNVNIGPATATELVEIIFDILDTSSRYLHAWPQAYQAMLRALGDADIEETWQQLMPELQHLQMLWSEIQNIVWAPA